MRAAKRKPTSEGCNSWLKQRPFSLIPLSWTHKSTSNSKQVCRSFVQVHRNCLKQVTGWFLDNFHKACPLINLGLTDAEPTEKCTECCFTEWQGSEWWHESAIRADNIHEPCQQVPGCIAKIETAIKNINLPNKKTAAVGIKEIRGGRGRKSSSTQNIPENKTENYSSPGWNCLLPPPSAVDLCSSWIINKVFHIRLNICRHTHNKPNIQIQDQNKVYLIFSSQM